jgi:HAD superfamily phosphoserine phosphatase-like hydrolase
VNNIILLDFDGTITSRDTTSILLIHLLLIRPWRIYGAAWFLFRMVFSTGSSIKQRQKNNAIGYLIKGLTDGDMTLALDQFSNKVRALYRPSMLKKINESIDNGTLILIVTASPSFVISHCVSDLPVTVIGTEFKKKGDFYCRQINGKNCYGDEKVNRIEFWRQDKGINCSFTEAWSDHFSDYPMLKMAKQRYWIGGAALQEIVDLKDPSGNFVFSEY